MAIWNDPQPTQTGFGASSRMNLDAARAANYDAGERRYMLSIYNYMASAVLLSGIVALVFASSGLAAQVFATPLRWLLILAPLGFVFALSAGFNRMATSTLQACFWGFAVVMGLSLSSIFLLYTGESIAVTFFATAGAFAGLSLFGYTTKKSLSGLGSFLTMAVWGLLITMLIGMFFPVPGLALVISVAGVLIFAGLTAYDTQQLKMMYGQVAGTPYEQRVAIMGSLNLYLDFINMFQFLLSLLGDRR
ncbi:BAX inhibitor (BI)-1/YccA family protein [Novosphingobium sp. FSY-8]|uniref:BAX inhibitor (BI)-1/YccA family protein n=1 Tax=Novosphingobium ovatum TaxID=1908523 RepID=A0ABW9XEA4_9SPHN|nr:Bax inhibitor-1/YccA family protein [Novosphingobium ovatum]NBC36856.1 BAX inhibitor (BI)-1/YccA family protein [Novosphingobium ovatum]